MKLQEKIVSECLKGEIYGDYCDMKYISNLKIEKELKKLKRNQL